MNKKRGLGAFSGLVSAVAVLLFMVSTDTLLAAGFAKERALVLEASGRVELVRDVGGRELVRPVAVSDNLQNNAKIVLKVGSRVVLIHLEDFKKASYSGPNTITVGESGFSSSSNATSSKVVGSVGPGGKKGKNVLTALREGRPGGIRLRAIGKSSKPIVLLAPQEEVRVLNSSPTFRWDAMGKSGPYQFVLRTEMGEVVYKAMVNGQSTRLPSHVKFQDGATYAWRVTLGRSFKGSDVSTFTLVTPEERAGLKSMRPTAQSSSSDRVLYGMLLEKLLLTSESKEYWKKMSAQYPRDPFFKQRSR